MQDSLRDRLSAALASNATDQELRQLAEAALSNTQDSCHVPEPEPDIPKVLIDCDPGGDDVVALFWLLSMQHQHACSIVGVTTTEGNVKAPLTYAAADKVLTLLSSVVDASIPICAQTPTSARQGTAAERGAARKQYAAKVFTDMRSSDAGDGLEDAAHIHGKDGMGGLASQLQGRGDYLTAPESYERLINTLIANPHQITILATGPLTNLADAERAKPGVLKLAKRIIIMGGAISSGGNITPLAEFNFAFDPSSAHLVMEKAGLTDIMLMPLDITTSLVCTDALTEQVVGRKLMRQQDQCQRPQQDRYSASVEGCKLFYRDLSDFMCETNMAYKETGGAVGFLVHDASTVAALFYPETLRFQRAQLRVVQGDNQQATEHALGGFTFVDNRHAAKTSANCWIGCSIDSSACLSIMVQDIKMLVNALPIETMAHAHPSYSPRSRLT